MSGHDVGEASDFGSLDSISGAEETADRIAVEAQKKRERLLEKARLDAASLVENEKRNALAGREKKIVELKKSLEKEKAAMESETEKRVSEISKKAKAQSAKEVSFLAGKFLDEIKNV
ncbi:MAG: hypothetical protein HY394_02690 [Candidatus Diapherotrites archaeon]|nr:hypothetical protein [Candidatus Diapherotrites archaeon]